MDLVDHFKVPLVPIPPFGAELVGRMAVHHRWREISEALDATATLPDLRALIHHGMPPPSAGLAMWVLGLWATEMRATARAAARRKVAKEG